MFLNICRSINRSNLPFLALTLLAVATIASLAAPVHATELVDHMHTSAIASAPISKASDRIFVIALVVTGFFTMAIGGAVLTLASLRDSADSRRRR